MDADGTVVPIGELAKRRTEMEERVASVEQFLCDLQEQLVDMRAQLGQLVDKWGGVNAPAVNQ